MKASSIDNVDGAKRAPVALPPWDRSLATLLGQLIVGDSFHFAQTRMHRLPGELIPEWKVEETGLEFYTVSLQPSPSAANDLNIQNYIKLPLSTKVQKIDPASPKNRA